MTDSRLLLALALFFGFGTAMTGNVRAEFGDVIWTWTPTSLDREPFNGAEFGNQVAMEGDLAIIGAPGDPFNGSEAGAVWVFDVATGEALHILDTPTLFPGDGLPEGVAMDGDIVLFSSDSRDLERGEAYVFNGRTAEYLTAINLGAEGTSGDEFGQAVGISGNLLLISAEGVDGGQGAGYLFDASTFQRLYKLTSNDSGVSEVGDTVALSGNHALLGAGSGAVLIFDAAAGTLREKLTIPEGGSFGAALAAQGDWAVSGAPGLDDERGAAYLIDLNSATIVREFRSEGSEPGDEFGDSLALDGSVVLVGAAAENDDAGAVYVFDRVTGMQVARLVSPNEAPGEAFGAALAVADGRALIGAEAGVVDGQASGMAYVFNVGFLDLADVDDNGAVDASDIDQLSEAVRTASTDTSFDVNHDGTVNEHDRRLWVAALNHTYFGDANLDGQFDSTDLVEVLASGTYEADVDSSWATGDFDGDRRTNSSDLVIALADGGYEAGPRSAVSSVPEPAAMTVILLAVAQMLLHRKRR
jgi:hypothetical protein